MLRITLLDVIQQLEVIDVVRLQVEVGMSSVADFDPFGVRALTFGCCLVSSEEQSDCLVLWIVRWFPNIQVVVTTWRSRRAGFRPTGGSRVQL